MPKIELPYEFISPYTPDECVERLKMEYGDHGNSVIQVRIKPQSDASYFFQVHIFARSFVYIAFDLMIDGYIESLQRSGTRVMLKEARRGCWAHVGFVAAFLLITLYGYHWLSNYSLILAAQRLEEILLIPFVVSGLYLLCVWIWRYARSTALQELTYLIEKTLLDEELEPLSASPSRWPNFSLGEKLKRGR
jgi:hypothetical protein